MLLSLFHDVLQKVLSPALLLILLPFWHVCMLYSKFALDFKLTSMLQLQPHC